MKQISPQHYSAPKPPQTRPSPKPTDGFEYGDEDFSRNTNILIGIAIGVIGSGVIAIIYQIFTVVCN